MGYQAVGLQFKLRLVSMVHVRQRTVARPQPIAPRPLFVPDPRTCALPACVSTPPHLTISSRDEGRPPALEPSVPAVGSRRGLCSQGLGRPTGGLEKTAQCNKLQTGLQRYGFHGRSTGRHLQCCPMPSPSNAHNAGAAPTHAATVRTCSRRPSLWWLPPSRLELRLAVDATEVAARLQHATHNRQGGNRLGVQRLVVGVVRVVACGTGRACLCWGW